MGYYQIRKGRDIRLKGAAEKNIVQMSLPAKAAILPEDFHGLKLRLAVKEGDSVKRGSVIFTDKHDHDIKILSPIAGKVAAIDRGEKRLLKGVVIATDGRQEAEVFQSYSAQEARNISRESVLKMLLAGGCWPMIRQRPFSIIANPKQNPKSIFVHAMNTEPLSPDADFILDGREEEFQIGLDILKKLTSGKVHLCVRPGAKSKALTNSKNVELHQFVGPHPSGNVGTHIHYIDPINKGEVVWYVEAQHVINIAQLFTQGAYPTERIVAVTGEGAPRRFYAKTITGAAVSSLLQGSNPEGMRVLSGGVLTGTNVGRDGFLCFHDFHLTVIPEGGKRELLGWLSPGVNKFTMTQTFLSAFLPEKEMSLDTDEHGGHRAIVMNHIYDSYNTLDVYTFFLLKAILAEDLDEAEHLGLLECDEEDFALCSVICPSKTDVGAIIRKGLDMVRREG